jgi:hypothetical protein
LRSVSVFRRLIERETGVSTVRRAVYASGYDRLWPERADGQFPAITQCLF